MATLVYVHGFLSSPQSHKAQITQCWLPEHEPHIGYRCLHLSPYPQETQTQLRQLMQSLQGQTVGFVGSSLGGFWSTWLVEHYGHRAVLINPSVRPHELVDRVVGEVQHNYYTDEHYEMTPAHGDQFRQAYPAHLKSLASYWLMVQTGDETLDYRLAVERYKGCQQLVEQGGDHAFQGYEEKLPAIVQFLFD